MAKREKKSIVTGVTEKEFNDSIAAYALADAAQDKLTAQMDLEVTKIREKYADRLSELDDMKERSFETCMTYCMENKAILFAKARSMETSHGRLGFRTGMPKLKTLPKWNWDRVLEKVGMLYPDLVRVNKEVDKDGILAKRTEAAFATELPRLGVYVAQEESFFIDLNKETA